MTTKQKLLPPKGPLGSFFQFQREKTQEMLQAHPGKNMAHITKLMGLAYNKLSIEEKKKYEDLAAADMERYNREAQDFEEKHRRRIRPPRRKKGLPTNDVGDDDNDEEIFKESLEAKKIKGDKVYDIRKNSNERVNKMQVEHAAGPRLGPSPNNPYVRRNPMNQVCFVQTDKLTGKETLIPYVYLLNKMISSMPKSQITPELLYQIETLRREDREDIKNGKTSGFEKKHPESTNKGKTQAPKKTKNLPTDDDDDDDDDDDEEEYEEEEESEDDPPKKMKSKKANDIKKDINDKENKMEVEDAAESIPGPDPNNPSVRRNSKNQICHVEVDELTGKETLIPYVYLLNEMISSMPESEVTPELQSQIEALMQEDKQDIEKGKGREKEMCDLGAADQEKNKKELEEETEECKILTKQRTNSLPTDDDEEEKENLPKKMKSVKLKVKLNVKAKEIKKHTNDKENKMKVETGAGSRLGSNPNNPSVCKNPLGQVCFVQTDEATGKEILIPYVYYLNSMVNSMPKSEITPELQRQINALRQEDKKDMKYGKTSGSVEKKKHYKYTRKRRLEAAKKRKNRLPTDNDKESKRKPAKKVKGGKAKKTKKDTGDKENKMEIEAAAEPIPDPDHHSSYLRRNSLNRVCFVKIDESTGEETLVPAMDTLNEIINSIPEAKLDPELRHKIELAMQEDREDIENGKISGEKMN